MTAGSLQHRFGFERRIEAPDGYGNTVADWQEQFEAYGDKTFFRGMEKVQDAASTGIAKAVIKVRSFAASRLVTTAWRLVDKRSGETWNILSVEPGKDRATIEFIAQSGGPDG